MLPVQAAQLLWLLGVGGFSKGAHTVHFPHNSSGGCTRAAFRCALLNDFAYTIPIPAVGWRINTDTGRAGCWRIWCCRYVRTCYSHSQLESTPPNENNYEYYFVFMMPYRISTLVRSTRANQNQHTTLDLISYRHFFQKQVQSRRSQTSNIPKHRTKHSTAIFVFVLYRRLRYVEQCSTRGQKGKDRWANRSINARTIFRTFTSYIVTVRAYLSTIMTT